MNIEIEERRDSEGEPFMAGFASFRWGGGVVYAYDDYALMHRAKLMERLVAGSYLYGVAIDGMRQVD